MIDFDDNDQAGGMQGVEQYTAVFDATGPLGITLFGKELRSEELPPGWTSRYEDGRTVYLSPAGAAQLNRPKSHEHQAAVVQAISPDGLAGKGQYYERSTPSMTYAHTATIRCP